MNGQKLIRELVGLFFVFCGLLIFLSLWSYDVKDPTFNHSFSRVVVIKNSAGIVGSHIAGLLTDVFGTASYLWSLFFVAMGAGMMTRFFVLPWYRWIGYPMLAAVFMTACEAWGWGIGQVEGGGLLGAWLYAESAMIFSPVGSALVWFFALLMAMELSFRISWLAVALKSAHVTAEQVKKLPKTRISVPSLPKLPKPHLPKSISSENSSFGRKRHKKELPPVLEVTPLPPRKKEKVVPESAPLTEDKPLTFEFSPESGADDRPAKTVKKHAAPVLTVEVEPEQEPLKPQNPPLGEDRTQEAEKVSPELTGVKAVPPQKHPEEKKPEAVEIPVAGEAEKDDDLPPFLLSSEEERPASPLLPPEKAAPPQEKVAPLSPAVPAAAPVPPAAAPAAVPPLHPQPREKRLPLPSADLLSCSTAEELARKPDPEILQKQGESLLECLQNFGVNATLDHVSPGPVITQFALRPAPGVKAGRFAPLSQDIAMSLKAEAVRVQSPIPGTDTVGVEVPNKRRDIVRFRDVVESEAFTSSKSLLTMALGKNIAGLPRTDDLAKMPHLLLAGATGAGKSVCLNAILLSLLYKARPDEVRLLLIDPKVVEFQVYDDLPHLVHPVVSDMDLARNALFWAVDEMERRYVLLNKLSVRKLDDYNAKVRKMDDPRTRDGEELTPLPYIVIVVDEFGDLILNKGKEVEGAIARLGQKARAAGIHLILATQSPRADVVTGLIKANLPSRIAFRTSGPMESRIIIDQGGAEALLGNGDMLLKASNGRLHRLHGAYVSDAEVEAVVNHWKKLQAPDFQVDFHDYGENQGEGFNDGRGGSMERNDVIDDPLYAESVQFAREKGFISISKLQQRYRIGFNKAARFVEQMEQDGIVGPPAPGGKARQVIG